MSVYLGKNKIGITKYENLDPEITEQETFLAELEESVNGLQEVEGELNINQNGKYNVTNYASVNVEVGSLLANVPEDFVEGTLLFIFRADDNTILVNSNSKSTGLYSYKIKEKRWNKLVSTDTYYNIFTALNDTYCILTTNTSLSLPVLLYNSNTDTVTPIIGNISGTPQVTPISETKIFIMVSSKLYVLNLETATATHIIPDGTSLSQIHKVSETKWLINSRSSSVLGVWLFDEVTYDYEKIYTEGYYWIGAKLNEDECIFSNSNSTYLGIFKYNFNTKEVTKIYEDGRNWIYTLNISSTESLISTATSSTTCILLYNNVDKTVTPIYTPSTAEYGWLIEFVQISETKWVFAGSSKGLLIFDASDYSFVKTFTSYTPRYLTITGSYLTGFGSYKFLKIPLDNLTGGTYQNAYSGPTYPIKINDDLYLYFSDGTDDSVCARFIPSINDYKRLGYYSNIQKPYENGYKLSSTTKPQIYYYNVLTDEISLIGFDFGKV